MAIFCLFYSVFERGFQNSEAQQPTQNPEVPPKNRLRELFRKVRANFCLPPCDTSQEPNRNCSEKLVQMSFFILGGFFGWIISVDFPPLKHNLQK